MANNIVGQPTKTTLYYMLTSPPCHTVIAVLRLIGLDVDLKEADFLRDPSGGGQKKKAAFAKLNPLKSVPTLVDTDGFKLAESRAIAAYLVQTYSPDSELYPSKDVKKRAVIDMYMHFEMGKFYRAMSDVLDNFWATGQINRAKIPRMEEMFQMFDSLLSQNNTPFIAGDHLTVADLSMHFHWRILEVFTEIDTSVYLAILAWNRKVVEALKPINSDGFFDKAFADLKEYYDMMRQGVQIN